VVPTKPAVVPTVALAGTLLAVLPAALPVAAVLVPALHCISIQKKTSKCFNTHSVFWPEIPAAELDTTAAAISNLGQDGVELGGALDQIEAVALADGEVGRRWVDTEGAQFTINEGSELRVSERHQLCSG
jgi:hypothetical protein